jgi:hypothetical protein
LDNLTWLFLQKQKFMKKNFILLLLSLLSFGLEAQKAIIREDSISVDLIQRKIVIPYTLQDGDYMKYEYKIDLYYSEDGGKTYRGAAEKVRGFVGQDILAGNLLVIWWLYGEEYPDFDGSNSRFKLKATLKPSVFNLKNEEAMKYSFLLPGLGQSKVRFYKKWKYQWLLTTAAVASCITGSVLLNQQANTIYERYKVQTDRLPANNLYEEMRSKKLMSYGLAALGAGIWIYDIVKVGIKGAKNRKEKERLLQRQEEMKSQVGFGVQSMGNSPLQFGIQYKF